MPVSSLEVFHQQATDTAALSIWPHQEILHELRRRARTPGPVWRLCDGPVLVLSEVRKVTNRSANTC